MSNRQAKQARRAAERERFISKVPSELQQPGQDLYVESAPGVHRWAVINTYELNDDECLDAHRTGSQVLLDLEHLRASIGPVCLVCERPWIEVHGKACAGDPDPSWKR